MQAKPKKEGHAPLNQMPLGSSGFVSEQPRQNYHISPQVLWAKLLGLFLLAALCIGLYMTIGVTDWGFALPRRGIKVVAMLLVCFSIAYSTVIFQTVTNNRILTPSIIGFDSVYMLIQTLIIFLFGGMTLIQMSKQTQFVMNVGCMVLFAVLLYSWLFKREGPNLYFLILIGMIFGTFFGSLTTFMQMVMDPNEFTVLQDRMFSSINNVSNDLINIAAVLVILTALYSLSFFKFLDPISLGRDQAINLGIDHSRVVNRCMVVIAIFVSVSTALVGPITFFGLLAANLSYEFMRTYRHSFLVPAASLISIIAIAGGQLLVERVFTFSTSISVIVNFIGGLYFLFLLLKGAKA